MRLDDVKTTIGYDPSLAPDRVYREVALNTHRVYWLPDFNGSERENFPVLAQLPPSASVDGLLGLERGFNPEGDFPCVSLIEFFNSAGIPPAELFLLF